MQVSIEAVMQYSLDGRYVGVNCFPDANQLLHRYNYVQISAIEEMSPGGFVDALTAALGQKPKRVNGELKARHLKAATKLRADNGLPVLFVIQDAHLLPPRTIRLAKPIKEMCEEVSRVGFVFSGDMALFSRKLARVKDLELRMEILEG